MQPGNHMRRVSGGPRKKAPCVAAGCFTDEQFELSTLHLLLRGRYIFICVIVPQAMRAPALPAGSLFMSSAAA
jgi:hypothetical protein